MAERLLALGEDVQAQLVVEVFLGVGQLVEVRVRVRVRAHDLAQPEGPSHEVAAVVFARDVGHELDQVDELGVVTVLSERQDRDPVVDLVREREHRVVHDDHVLEAAALQDPQVFDKQRAAVGLDFDARVPEQAVLDQRAFGIERVEHGGGVVLGARREHDDFEVLVGLFESLHRVGPDVDAHLKYVRFAAKQPAYLDCGLAVFGANGDAQVWLASAVGGVDLVDEGLVHVEDDRLGRALVRIELLEVRQSDLLGGQLGMVDLRQRLDVVGGLHHESGELSEKPRF